VCVQLSVLRANTLPHLGSCSCPCTMASALTGCYKSSISVEIDSDILNTIARHHLLFIKVSGFRHSLASSLWSVGCLALVCSIGSTQKDEGAVRAFWLR
jgi:hypothetical protein